MLTEDGKRRFVLSTINPMADHTMRFLTQVIGVVDPRTGDALGTGIFAVIDGEGSVVTAAHVLRDAASKGGYDSLAFTRGSDDPPKIVPGSISYWDEFDLAVYRPDRPYPLGSQKAFWPEERIDREITPAVRDYLFFQGFPRRFSRFTTLGGGGLVSESLAYGAMMRPRPEDLSPGEVHVSGQDLVTSDLLRPHQFALNFSFDDADFLTVGDHGAEPKRSDRDDWREVFRSGGGATPGGSLPGQKSRGAFGLSGSPVFRIGAAGKKIRDWEPSWSRLVGLVTHWNEKEHILIATKASKLFEVVKARG